MKSLNKTHIKPLFSRKAFSLIEILLVVFIIGFLFTVGSQRIFNKDKKVRTVFDKFIRLNNRLVSISTLHGKTYRLVIQLDAEKKDQYWVEKKQAGGEFADDAESEKEGSESEDDIESESEEQKTDNIFQIDDSFYPEPQNLPSFLDITKIETKGSSKEKGKIYIYYRPLALAQSVKIYFLRPDNQGKWTLYLDPVTKKMQVLKDEK